MKKAIDLIDFQINWIEKQLLAEQSIYLRRFRSHAAPKISLKWTGSIIEWVELIYALYLVKRINNGTVSLKDLFRQMGEVFDFEVKEFSNYFMNIKNRTDGKRTKFVDFMKDVTLEKITESDRKPSRK